MLRAIFILLTTFAFCVGAVCQERLPEKFTAYKTYGSTIRLTDRDKDGRVSTPEIGVDLVNVGLRNLGLSGVDVELAATLSPAARNGDIEYITFDSVKVNGLAVAVDSYSTAFRAERGSPIRLSPVRIRVPAATVARTAFREAFQKRSRWRIQGKATVYGRFKWMGFALKRAVPVDVDIEIDNPLN